MSLNPQPLYRMCRLIGSKPTLKRLFTIVLLLGFIWNAAAYAEHPPAAAVATAHPLATEAGLEILRTGGNAFDAAVAATAALAVVEPYASGLGGGGFWLLYRARDAYSVVIDGRETAPAEIRRDLYLDQNGWPLPGKSIDGPLAAGIPGVPAGLEHMAVRYGRLPLKHSLAPAIRLARQGFPVSEHYRQMAELRHQALNTSPAAAAVFLAHGSPPPLGYTIQQPDLAHTLEILAAQGARAFYEGMLARRLSEGVRASGGIWTLEDLRRYRIVERPPVSGDYHGIRIVSAAPPSSGGVVLIEALNILAGYRLPTLDGITRKHLLIEAMRRAYRDRAEYLGDPDFVDLPLARLLDKSYARVLGASISLAKATPSAALPAITDRAREAANTSHFSILDAAGNRVAATLSINYPFGSGFMVPGTGIVLNDELDDFAINPALPNVYGLVGGQANALAPGKRPLSSMTPTFLETPDRIAILGTPGGSRIISMVLLAVLDFAAGRAPLSWVSLPRFHHQYLPDQVEYEPGALNEMEQAGLRHRGHRLQALTQSYGNMQAILWDKTRDIVEAASDPRGEGSANLLLPVQRSCRHTASTPCRAYGSSLSRHGSR